VGLILLLLIPLALLALLAVLMILPSSLFNAVILLACMFFVQACSVEDKLVSSVSVEQLETAKQKISVVLSADYKTLNSAIANIQQNPLTVQTINQVRQTIPQGKPLVTQLVGYKYSYYKTQEKTTRHDYYTFQYHYPDRWFLVQIGLLTENEQRPLISAFYVQPIPGDLKEIHKFTFDGKPVSHYLMLLAAVVIPVFIIISLVICYKTPIPKRKWLWYLFIGVGLFGVQLEWTTGQWAIEPLAFYIFGSGFFRASLYAPVIISVTIPVGAILFHLKRKKWENSLSANSGE
jgi:hypothetical protein